MVEKGPAMGGGNRLESESCECIGVPCFPDATLPHQLFCARLRPFDLLQVVIWQSSRGPRQAAIDIATPILKPYERMPIWLVNSTRNVRKGQNAIDPYGDINLRS